MWMYVGSFEELKRLGNILRNFGNFRSLKILELSHQNVVQKNGND